MNSNHFLDALVQRLNLMNAYYPDGISPRGRNDKPKEKGKTRRGAIHKQGKAFKPFSLSGISPAEYRRRHLGAK
jgi:hypothetical protein